MTDPPEPSAQPTGPPETDARAAQPAAAGEHPVNGLDDVVHQRVRLGILTITHEARRVEFGYLRGQLQLTAGNLSKHLTVLEEASLVAAEKGYEGKRARTWVTLTPAGRAALFAEIDRLKQLISRVDALSPSED